MREGAEVDCWWQGAVGGVDCDNAAAGGADHGDVDGVAAFPGDFEYGCVGGSVEVEEEMGLGFVGCEDGGVDGGGEERGEIDGGGGCDDLRVVGGHVA